MKNIKAIFFDIDGTLVSFKTHRIAGTTLETLRQLKDKGIKLYIASGRHYLIMDNLEGFPFDGYICMNGGLVYDGGSVISSKTLDPRDAKTVADFAEARKIPCAVFGERKIGINLLDDLTQKVFGLVKMPEPPVISIREAAEEPVHQYTIFIDGAEEEILLPMLENTVSTRWHPQFTDLIPKGLSKAEAVAEVIGRHGLSREEVMAFGDGGNDVEMLEYAGIGVAMGNADDQVKKYADYVTAPVDDDGITEAIKRFRIL